MEFAGVRNLLRERKKLMAHNNGSAIKAAEGYLANKDKVDLTTTDGDKVLCVPSSCLERLVVMSKRYLEIARVVKEVE